MATFGYPASRDFQFMGCTSQFFQRLVMQQCGTQGVGTLNLLDDGLLPYTTINGSTFPAVDADAQDASRRAVTDPNYASAILEFVARQRAGHLRGPAGQLPARRSTARSRPSVAGTSDPDILGLLALEVWGAPTSKPAYDPSNRNFIYQRFQRGIMHYDKACGCTQGLLLADYLKALITGENLPADLATQAASSPLLRAATPSGTAPERHRVRQRLRSRRWQRRRPAQPAMLAAAAAAEPVRPAPPPARHDRQPAAPVSEPRLRHEHVPVGQPDDHRARPEDRQRRQLRLAEDALPVARRSRRKGKGKFDWTEADRIVKASKQAGVKIIARLDFQPAWARKDGALNGPPDNYQDFCGLRLGVRHALRTGSAIGTGRRDRDLERGQPGPRVGHAADQPAAGRRLRAAADAAPTGPPKTANPQIIVITAGLSPTGVKTSRGLRRRRVPAVAVRRRA